MIRREDYIQSGKFNLIVSAFFAGLAALGIAGLLARKDRKAVLLGAGGAVLVFVAVFAAFVLFPAGSFIPPNGATVTATPRVSALGQSDSPRSASASSGTASASASCVSPSGNDAGGTTVTYGSEKAIDGLLDTAWRCVGDGVGQRLEISFPDRITLTSIGIVPGYAKTDPYDGTDRYAQNRRISAVHYTFDDGSTVSQSFNISASYRSIQTLALPNVSTSHVTITILSSVSGETTGGQQPRDNVAISEVTFSV
ncbi:MAG: discoidin domain-containing protein [Actinobacteria bacterium]|nr:discoidin domain-containing protein [Actinomycetota bacterium]